MKAQPHPPLSPPAAPPRPTAASQPQAGPGGSFGARQPAGRSPPGRPQLPPAAQPGAALPEALRENGGLSGGGGGEREGWGGGGAEQTSCDLRTGRAAPLPLPVAAVAGMRRGPVPVVAFVLALGAAARGGGSGPVTCGSVVKLLNVRHNVRLHSHDVRYGSGNGFRPPPHPPRCTGALLRGLGLTAVLLSRRQRAAVGDRGVGGG